LPEPTRELEESPTPTQGSTEQSAAGIDLAVARGGEAGELVRAAIKSLGGMEVFVPKGSRVVIKPNICVAYHSYEYAATTNPWVVGELVRMCLEAGAKNVQVLDYPFGGTPKQAYAISGIQEQVEACGGEMHLMSDFKFVKTELPQGVDLQEVEIYADVLQADVLINVPIAKHHSLAGLTLGMKNLMGTIRDRPQMHRNLGQRLVDLASRVRPTLTVVDAVRVLMDNGPTGGDLNDVRRLDTVIASADIVAADAYAATLFARRPEEFGFVTAGADMGLGRKDLEQLKIEEISLGG
jgi:uncharacterized protein (DUF362 family)